MIALYVFCLVVGVPLFFAVMGRMVFGPGPSRLRLSQARYRIGRLAGPTRGDLRLSEGMPLADKPATYFDDDGREYLEGH